MTTLRDDGYLETDDPVVSSCFLGHEIIDGLDDFLDSVGALTVGFCDEAGYESSTDYPILIPAKTVAEVQDDDLRAARTISEYGNFGRAQVDAWIRTHTQVGP